MKAILAMISRHTTGGKKRPLMVRGAVALAALGIVLAGCSSSSDSKESASGKEPTSDAASSEAPASGASGETLVLGGYLSAAGKTSRVNGKVVGVDADLCRAVVDQMGRKASDIQDLDLNAMVASIQAHRTDIVCTGSTVTADREKQVIMIPFRDDRYGLAVLPANKTKYTDPMTLCGLDVGANDGGTNVQWAHDLSDACVKAGRPAYNVKISSSVPAQLEDLKIGRIQAVIYPEVNINYFGSHGVSITASWLQEKGSPTAFLVAKDRPELAEAISKALVEIRKNGTYEKIMTADGLSSGSWIDDFSYNK